MKKTKNRINTNYIHAGYDPLIHNKARLTPIYQTTSFTFDDCDHAADLFSLKKEGNIYSRITNPTVEVLEKRMAICENGLAALALSSGQAAITLAILGITKCNEEIISTNSLYGGTYNLFTNTLSKMGIKVNFFNSHDYEKISSAINSKTKLIYSESIGNPKLDICNIEKLSQIAHQKKIPLIIDNTCCPYLLQPINFGADIIVYSATKFLGGHGSSIGGIIIDSGNFIWENNPKFSELTEPDPNYHGIKFVDFFRSYGNIAYINKIRLCYLRDLGPCLSPFNAFLFLNGLETLPLRMERHVKNARQVAEFLNNHNKVAWINYPGLSTHPDYQLTQKYLSKGAGSIIGFGIKKGFQASKNFINKLNLFSHLANIGDTKSLVIHPASTTHQQLTSKEQLSTGVSPDYIRLSIGIEDINDIIEDLEQALQII